MALLLKELSTLEVEPLEMLINTPGQERSLDTLMGSEVAVLLTSNGNFSADGSGDLCFSCCFCCCPTCCCVDD